jgi:hypothetical protein
MGKQKCFDILLILFGLSLPFLASFVPLPSVALMIPIFYNRLIDNLSTN